ncbi:MAG: FAD:protein FMN transferase [Candidatus Brocadiae bacterium]|nr:FAD:protein FMN transferase [Candidatus Brocadiia bacterium]
MNWKSFVRILLSALAIIFCFSSLFWWQPPWQTVEREWELIKWNSGQMQIIFQARKSHSEMQQIANTAYKQIERLDSVINEHDPKSEAGKLRLFMEKGEKNSLFPLSDELFSLVQFALLVSQNSQGVFDITISSYINLWKKCTKENRLPTEEEIQSVKKITGFQHIQLDYEKKALGIRAESLSISLGAFVKGYAVDQVASFLQSQKVPIGMVNMGGNIFCYGPRVWKIGIQDPRIQDPDAPQDSIAVIALENKGIATSAHYRRYYEIQGKRYSHILDPRTGNTVSMKVACATVIASTAMEADAYSTVFCILTPQESLELAKSLNLDAMIIVQEGEKYRRYETPGFEKYWVTKPPEIFQKQ